MKPDVFFFTARTSSYDESMSKIKGPLSLKRLGLEDKLKNEMKVVIKTHFGAEDNVRYLRPSYIRFLCDYIKVQGGTPSVAESCGFGVPGDVGEYAGRAGEEEYLDVALKHGYTKETMAAPLLMLDGPIGIDHEIQKIDGKIFNEVQVAGKLRDYDLLILASHFKGHFGAGFGGAIKNLGIGCVSKGGKVEAHTGKTFNINVDKCVSGCEKCIDVCPVGALTKIDDNLIFSKEKCVYCYMCASRCKKEIINLGSATTEEFIIHMIDNAKGVVEYYGKDRIFYVNYAIDITYQCDCSGASDVPIVSDIGILSSLDPVALDQACIDLVHLSHMNPSSVLGSIERLSSHEKNEWFSYTPRFDPINKKVDFNEDGKISNTWDYQLKIAEESGLGSRHYNLIEVKIEKPEN